MRFEVWAPRPSRVDLRLSGRDIPMQPSSGGDWVCEVDAPFGSDYSFILDGEVTPDPRSPFQPEGVHGPSRTVDHKAFRWSDQQWKGFDLADAVLYEMHVGTFTKEGTFEAVKEKLDHLVALGVSAIELMPVAEFPGSRGWGYDGVDLFAPHHSYGGPEALKGLVDACHSAGLGVILDVVYNHLGPDGNYLDRFGPYFTDKYSTPWGAAVNFDGPGSDHVREFVCENAEMWLRDFHFDGLRLDAVHAIYDCSAIHILEELKTRVDLLEKTLGRPLWVIAESDLNDPRIVSEANAGGYGLDAQWNDDFHHALHSVLTGETSGYYADFGSMADLAKSLRERFVYDGCFSTFRERRHGRSAVHIPATKFLAYSQNHDQVGNRAKGERSSHLVGIPRLKQASALVLLGPMVPMLFQGEEWGSLSPFLYFTDHNEQLGAQVREGRRREFSEFEWNPEEVPDPQATSSFESSILDWANAVSDNGAELLHWYRKLIEIRKSHSLSSGHLEVESGDDWVVLRRKEMVVAVNFGGDPIDIRLEEEPVGLVFEGAARASDATMTLGPESVAVVSSRPL